MTRITDMRGDLQVESSGSLFKSPLAQIRGHIVAAPLDLVGICPTMATDRSITQRGSSRQRAALRDW